MLRNNRKIIRKKIVKMAIVSVLILLILLIVIRMLVICTDITYLYPYTIIMPILLIVLFLTIFIQAYIFFLDEVRKNIKRLFVVEKVNVKGKIFVDIRSFSPCIKSFGIVDNNGNEIPIDYIEKYYIEMNDGENLRLVMHNSKDPISMSFKGLNTYT